jgi:hypothetical protein
VLIVHEFLKKEKPIAMLETQKKIPLAASRIFSTITLCDRSDAIAFNCL